MRHLVQRVLKVGAWAEVELVEGMGQEARRALTLQPLDSSKMIAQYRNHPSDKTKLYIPRALVNSSGLDIEGEWDRIKINTEIKYREGQKETIDSFLQALADRKSPYGGILQAVTGAGKTVMAIDIMKRLGLKTLIIVPRTSLMAQWFNRIQEYTGLNGLTDIGMIQGDVRKYKDYVVTVAMIHTLSQQLESFPKDFYHSFGTVIFDECHTVGAETFSKTAPMFRCKYRVGLSATPRRADGMDKVFHWHIGPIVSKFMKLQATARIRILPYVGPDTSHSGCVWGGNLNLGRYLNRVANSPQRLDFLTRIVNTLDSKGHDILVLSDRVQHLKTLKARLIARGIDANKIGLLIGSEKQLDKKIILGTYGSAGMGVDIPRLTALVLATPRADIEQAVGRVLRQGSPIVVDIVDIASNIMNGWSMARKKYYRKITTDIQDRTLAA